MSTASAHHPVLIYDLIVRVLEICRSDNDYGLISRCALVNWEWNRAASRVLYEHVVVAPSYKRILDLRDTGAAPDACFAFHMELFQISDVQVSVQQESSNFTSACLPQYAQYVLSLEITGFVSARPPPRNALAEALPSALKSFVNLQSVRFAPATYHDNLFTQPLSLLLNLRAMTSLTVNASCSDDTHAPQLVQVSNLHALTLISPGRAILDLLPDWLARLAGTLEELHLKDNCGSVTPGVLRALVPYIRDTVTAFTLGLSYSLTDGDVFTFLGQLTRLRSVHLRYYWQMRHPENQPALRGLRAFGATYERTGTAREVADLDAWVRRAVRGSPDLHTLRLQCEQAWVHLHAHDGLVDHVVRTRTGRIRVLDLGVAVVSKRRLREVLQSCGALEEASMAVDRSALDVFAKESSGLQNLRSVIFQISNMPKKMKAEQLEESVRKMMSDGPPSLRRVQINDVAWGAFWDSGSTFVVRRAEDLVPPWRRTN